LNRRVHINPPSGVCRSCSSPHVPPRSIFLFGGTCIQEDQNWISVFPFSGSKLDWRKQMFPYSSYSTPIPANASSNRSARVPTENIARENVGPDVFPCGPTNQILGEKHTPDTTKLSASSTRRSRSSISTHRSLINNGLL
jgi:hypothetical protein